MSDRRRAPLVAAAVLAVAVAARTLPLYRSPLPFNPDGVVHSGNARAVVATGSLPTSRLATDDLAFTAFLSAVAEVAGARPLVVAQPTAAVVGAVPCLVAAALARRWVHRADLDLAAPRLAAGTAGGLLAVGGLYLHRSTPADEQTLGLLVVPLLAVAYWRWLGGDRRWGLAAVALAAVLPPLHNLDGVVGALTLTALVAARATGATARETARAALPVAAFWTYLAGYHVAVDRFTPAAVIQTARFSSVPGLVVAWAVLMVAGTAWARGRTARTRRRVAAASLAGPFVLLAVNALGPVFPGTPATSPVLLAALLPFAVPVAVAVVGVGAAGGDRTAPLALALVAGPLALVGMALTAGLTPEYLETAYRVQPFVHLPLAALVGLGVAVLAAGRDGLPAGARRLRAGALVAAVLVAAAASVPVAFGGLAVVPYKGVTTPGELAAAGFARTAVPGGVAADDHLARVGRYFEPSRASLHDAGDGVRVGPVHAWLAGDAPPPRCPVVVQGSWTTTGAQVYPAPPARAPAAALERWRASRSVVYAGGADDPIHLVVPRSGSGGRCR